jgi:SAM-dependent methyltransferase
MRQSARAEFDKWAASYDRSFLNELVFLPTIRACREELARWHGAEALVGKPPVAPDGPADGSLAASDGDSVVHAGYRLLDVGCGTGNLLACLAGDDEARELVGLDFSPEMVRLAGEKFAAHPAAERLRVVHGDAEHLPFEAGAFDALCCCHSFHHYPHQAAVIREFWRVLRPGGLLILIDGFRDNVVGWIVFDVAVALVERHVHHAAWSEIRRWVEEAGFARLTQRKLNVLAPLLVNVATR